MSGYAGKVPVVPIVVALGVCGACAIQRGAPPVQAQSPEKPRLLVLNKAESTLVVVDPDTLQVVGRVPTGLHPHEVTVSADGKTAFVANYGAQEPGHTLSVIDVASARETRRVDLAPLRRPHGLAELGGKVYFTAEENRAVGRYDPAAGKVDWIVGTGQTATHMLAVDPAAGRIYTANIISGTVSALDLAAPQAPQGAAQVPVGPGPEGIALSPDGSELWVGHVQGGQVTVLDTRTDQVKAKLSVGGPAIRLHFTPDGKRVLASDPQAGAVTVLDAAARQVVKRIPVGPSPVGIAVSPDGRRAFVSLAAARSVAVLDLQTLEVTGKVETGEGPDGIAWAAPRPVTAARKPGLLGVAVGPREQGEGVVVQAVNPGSPAEKAGLKAGDVVLSLDGAPVQGPPQFQQLVMRSFAGQVLTFAVERGGRKLELKATLAPRPVP